MCLSLHLWRAPPFFLTFSQMCPVKRDGSELTHSEMCSTVLPEESAFKTLLLLQCKFRKINILNLMLTASHSGLESDQLEFTMYT